MDSDDENNLPPNSTAMLLKQQTQTPQDRRDIRDKYLELIENAQKQNESGEFDADKLTDSMNEANVLFQEVTRPREAIYDAKLINIHGDMIKKKAHAIQAGTPFHPASFLKKLAVELTGKHSDSNVTLDKGDFLKIGNKVSALFNMTPKLNFMQGTFHEPTEIVVRQRRVKDKDPKTKAKESTVIGDGTLKANSDKTYEEIHHIKKELIKFYRKNDSKPVCYFSFAIDPTSFSKTIENMFHLSFLIKEREILLSMDRDELPVIEPVSAANGSVSKSESYQSVLTMSVEKWKQLVEAFEITQAAISPLSSSKHHKR